MQVTIRKAKKADAPVILSFIKKIADYEQMADEVENNVIKIENKLFGEQPIVHALIIETDQQEPIGFAVYFFNYSTFTGEHGLYLEDFFIDEKYRRQGIGSQVFDKLFSIAKEHDCARMDWVVLDWNEPAINFYEKLEAKPMSDWIQYRLTNNQFSTEDE